MVKRYQVNSLEETQVLASTIAKICHPSFFVLLSGDLGAGKTTFTKNLLKSLGVKEKVTSPTFNIVQQYRAKDFQINHMDAYRLTKDDDLLFYLEDYSHCLNLIEWYENVSLPKNIDFLKITFKIINETTREIIVEGERE